MPSQRTKADELIPSARRLVTSLRDLGYDFSAAVADIIDNSIAARAKTVWVDVVFRGANSWVRIADDGEGMNAARLLEAMRYGAERDYEAEDLGKFGLGLKTASLSQCQRLTVLSRSNPHRQNIVVKRWDLNHIQKTDRWELLSPSVDKLADELVDPLRDRRGTVVFWEQLDRILDYNNPYSEFARKRLFQMCRELESHVSMVFHRFLAGEAKRRLKIFINQNLVQAWDPFARNESRTKPFKPTQVEIEYERVHGVVDVEPYVLPHQDDFSSPQAHAAASGPLKWNRQQGFYIYRSDRMIQSGGWCGLRTADEHTKLARIALRFQPRLDEAFKINVAKMRVQLPPQFREEVERALGPVLRSAQVEYRDRGASHRTRGSSASGQGTASSDQHASGGDAARSGKSEKPDSGGHMTPKIFWRELVHVANKGEKTVLSRLATKLLEAKMIDVDHLP